MMIILKVYLKILIDPLTKRKINSKQFINGVPQVAIYAKILANLLGIETRCVIFNSDDYWLFDHDGLDDITDFMKSQKLYVPWSNLPF